MMENSSISHISRLFITISTLSQTLEQKYCETNHHRELHLACLFAMD